MQDQSIVCEMASNGGRALGVPQGSEQSSIIVEVAMRNLKERSEPSVRAHSVTMSYDCDRLRTSFSENANYCISFVVGSLWEDPQIILAKGNGHFTVSF